MDNAAEFVAKYFAGQSDLAEPQLRLTLSFRLEDEDGSKVIDLTSRHTGCLIDNGPRLPTANNVLADLLQAHVHAAKVIVAGLVDDVRAAAARAKPDPEFPEHMRSPIPTRPDWNDRIIEPAYVPAEDWITHDARSRPTMGMPQLVRGTGRPPQR